jgi:hypothetical protein
LRCAVAFIAISALAGCITDSSSSSTSANSTSQSTAPQPASTSVSLADLAAEQRTCIGGLKTRLASFDTKRIDAFLAQTLNGLEVCDADYGLAHLPTRDVSKWLNGADGKKHPATRVPDQPAAITQLPRDGPARVRYQRFCIGWMDRYLPADIAKSGDDPDTAAADVFNGIEECDAVAGFATISRDELARLVKTKNLN